MNAYLTKPTTRLARYPLLLNAVLKHTPDDSPDKILLPQVVTLVKEFLAKVNTESGKTENRFNLIQLDQQLLFKPGEQVVCHFASFVPFIVLIEGQNLRLKEEGREMIYKGALNKRDGEIQVYLFDHAILFTKQVKTKQHDQYKVYRRVSLSRAPRSIFSHTITSLYLSSFSLYQRPKMQLEMRTSKPGSGKLWSGGAPSIGNTGLGSISAETRRGHTG